jgi:hypothetical protein
VFLLSHAGSQRKINVAPVSIPFLPRIRDGRCSFEKSVYTPVLLAAIYFRKRVIATFTRTGQGFRQSLMCSIPVMVIRRKKDTS